MVILKVQVGISAVMHLVRMENVLLMAQQVVLHVGLNITTVKLQMLSIANLVILLVMSVLQIPQQVAVHAQQIIMTKIKQQDSNV